MAFDVDLFVIGAGSGGVRAARIAAEHGAKVIVAEEFRVGGTCVIRGCVPKKLLVYASRFADDFSDAEGFGWSVGPSRFDWPTLVAAKEREISRLSAIYRANLAKAGVELIEERAELIDAHNVRLAGGRTASARHILVATGARPEPARSIEGLEHAITSNEIFDLETFPSRLLIVGGGYIAVEFASLFARLGAEVIEVMRAGNVLRGFDEDMRDGLRDELRRAGVELRFGCLPTRIEKRGARLHVALSDGDALEADQVLVATGRKPNTRGLGLERLGVALDAAGAIVVDSASTSSVPSIHAVGDVTDRINLTPVAIREGHALADRLFGGERGRRRSRQRRPRGLRHPGDRRGRPHRGRGDAALRRRRHLQDQLQADEGDAFGQRRAHDHEAGRRRGDEPRGGRAYPRPRGGGDDPNPRDRHQDGRDQGRSRRHDGGPSDRRRGAGDDAHARRPDRTSREDRSRAWPVQAAANWRRQFLAVGAGRQPACPGAGLAFPHRETSDENEIGGAGAGRFWASQQRGRSSRFSPMRTESGRGRARLFGAALGWRRSSPLPAWRAPTAATPANDSSRESRTPAPRSRRDNCRRGLLGSRRLRRRRRSCWIARRDRGRSQGQGAVGKICGRTERRRSATSTRRRSRARPARRNGEPDPRRRARRRGQRRAMRLRHGSRASARVGGDLLARPGGILLRLFPNCSLHAGAAPARRLQRHARRKREFPRLL